MLAHFALLSFILVFMTNAMPLFFPSCIILYRALKHQLTNTVLATHIIILGKKLRIFVLCYVKHKNNALCVLWSRNVTMQKKWINRLLQKQVVDGLWSTLSFFFSVLKTDCGNRNKTIFQVCKSVECVQLSAHHYIVYYHFIVIDVIVTRTSMVQTPFV